MQRLDAPVMDVAYTVIKWFICPKGHDRGAAGRVAPEQGPPVTGTLLPHRHQHHPRPRRALSGSPAVAHHTANLCGNLALVHATEEPLARSRGNTVQCYLQAPPRAAHFFLRGLRLAAAVGR